MAGGGCHCGAIRYEMEPEGARNAICHCSDCRRHSGAPLVAWTLVPIAAVTVTGEPATYASSEHALRHFCPTCGTGLFYTNATVFGDRMDVQTATLDDPDAFPPGVQVQAAERIGWVANLHEIPAFERFPE